MRARHPARHPISRAQRGVVLLEVLIAVLIFSFGILGMIGLQSGAIKNAGDARLRTEASYLVGQLVSQMWVDQASLANYSHQAQGDKCVFKGAQASSANVTSWLGSASKAGTVLGTLPNASAQVVVDAATRRATVTLCWRAPQDSDTHNFTSTALISG
jgi:type IV pilus assembly protein PilV